MKPAQTLKQWLLQSKRCMEANSKRKNWRPCFKGLIRGQGTCWHQPERLFFNEQCLLVRLSYHAGTRLCNFLLQTTKMVLPVVHGTRQIVKRTTFLPAYFKVVRIPKLTLYTFRSYFRVFAVIVRLSYHAWTRMCNFYHKHQRWYFQL